MTLSLPWDWLPGADTDPLIQALQDNFERVAKQFPVVNENTQELRVHGTVAGDGTIANGSGFTVAHNATGDYTITFDPPFRDTPTVVVIIAEDTDCYPINPTRSTTSADIEIRTVTTQANIDRQFSFIAVGAR